ncbi:protein of unknown function [Magnetospira sp. QH-2]|nr:protein of unknown function [Magnetospira sp. QH-2]
MSKAYTFIAMLSLSAMLSGCLKYHIGGEFESTGQQFFGSVTVTMDHGSIDVATADGSVTCSGSSGVTSRPSLYVNTGATGEAEATCSDGRTFKVDFVQTSEAGGHGQGIDNEGNVVWVIFSRSANSVESKVRQRQLDKLVK